MPGRKLIGALVLCLLVSLQAQAQLQSTQTVSIEAATIDTTPIQTPNTQQLDVQWLFGTVTGTYTTCTVQAKTSWDGTNYLTLGAAVAVTATSSTNNVWIITPPAATTVSSTAANSFGALTKLTFACSGYGTTAPSTVTMLAKATRSSGGSFTPAESTTLTDIKTAAEAIQVAAEDTTATDVTLKGYLAVVSSGSSVLATGASPPTDDALVTVATGTRIILHGFAIECSNTVSVRVTARLGFGTATIPADKAAGLIYEMSGTTPNQRGGINALKGWPNVEAVGGDGEDLRLTMSVPTGDECEVAYKYSLEAVE